MRRSHSDDRELDLHRQHGWCDCDGRSDSDMPAHLRQGRLVYIHSFGYRRSHHQHLRERFGLRSIVGGSSNEAQLASQIRGALNLAGKTNLRQLTALMQDVGVVAAVATVGAAGLGGSAEGAAAAGTDAGSAEVATAGPECEGGACFAAGTPLLWEHGSKAIEHVSPSLRAVEGRMHDRKIFELKHVWKLA